MESSQMVCSSPPFCKLEPESPPSWDSTWESVDLTESNFGVYWPEEWKDVKDYEGIKNFSHEDELLDLETLMKEEPFTWIDERNDGLYTTSFDWSPNDIKVFNGGSTAVSIDQKPYGMESTTATSPGNSASLQEDNINSSSNNNNTVVCGGIKIYHTNNNHHSLLSTPSSSSSSLVAAVTASTDTPDLLREFEDVLISTTTASLTPPESPRDQTTSLMSLLQEMEPCTTSSSSSDIDAIVATQAENMVPHNLHHQVQSQQQYQQQQQHQQPPSSPDPWSSPSMGSSSSCSDSGYDDPDWSPGPPVTVSNNNHSSSSSSSSSPSSGRRKRAAATTTEERKLRKKEQNKNAATRYRQKKKQEIEVIIGEEKELLDTHERLKADVTEITREIRYLKSLLRDLYKAKGLIS